MRSPIAKKALQLPFRRCCATFLACSAFTDGGRGITGEHVVKVLTEEIYWIALFNTIAVCGAAAVVATVLGTLFAWIFVRTDTLGRGALERIAQIPIFIPPFVGAVAWAPHPSSRRPSTGGCHTALVSLV